MFASENFPLHACLRLVEFHRVGGSMLKTLWRRERLLYLRLVLALLLVLMTLVLIVTFG